MSKTEKRVKLRMMTSSTAARAGAIVERPEKEAVRLINAGYAELYDEDSQYATKADLDALAERVAALEAAGKSKGNTGKGK